MFESHSELFIASIIGAFHEIKLVEWLEIVNVSNNLEHKAREMSLMRSYNYSHPSMHMGRGTNYAPTHTQH